MGRPVSVRETFPASEELGSGMALMRRRPSVAEERGTSRRQPNIFHAAVHNDLRELALAIQEGQHLDDTLPQNGHTPLHTAAIWDREDFIRAALAYSHANVWARDRAE